MALIFLLYKYIYLFTQNWNNYKLWRILRVLDGGCKEIGGSLSNQIFSWRSDFSNTCAALHYHTEAWVLLDSCKAAVIWKVLYFFSNSCSGGGFDFLPTRHPIHNNHFFTVSDDGKCNHVRGHRIFESFLHAILRTVPFQGLPFCHWGKNNVSSF